MNPSASVAAVLVLPPAQLYSESKVPVPSGRTSWIELALGIVAAVLLLIAGAAIGILVRRAKAAKLHSALAARDLAIRDRDAHIAELHHSLIPTLHDEITRLSRLHEQRRPPAHDPCLRTLATQRAELVGGCLKLRALVDDDILREVLDEALRGAGVSTFDATGNRLDPSRHRVARTVPAPDPDADGIIAQTRAPGYLDDGQVLKPADVVVYRWADR